MAREFLKSRCDVTVSGRREKSFEVVRKELHEFSDKVLYVPCNARIKPRLETFGINLQENGVESISGLNNARQNCSN